MAGRPGYVGVQSWGWCDLVDVLLMADAVATKRRYDEKIAAIKRAMASR